MRFYDNLLGHHISDPKLQINDHGHRCKNLKDIDLHNYLLFAGDNVALDFNLPMEETYPYLTSKELELDYYNLSIFNGGIDAVKYNLISWFTHTKYQPKAVIVSFEFINSIITCDSAFDNFNVADYNDGRVKQISTTGDISGFFPSRHMLTSLLMQRLILCPIIQVEFKNRTPLFNSKHIFNIEYDVDMFDHPSISSKIVKVYDDNIRELMP